MSMFNKGTVSNRQDGLKTTFKLNITENGNTLVVDFNRLPVSSSNAKDLPHNPLQDRFLAKAENFTGKPSTVAMIDGKECSFFASNANEKTGEAILVTSTYPGSKPIVTDKGGKILADGYVGACAKGVPCEMGCYAIHLLKDRPSNIEPLVQNTMLLRAGYNTEFEDYIVGRGRAYAAVRFNAFGDFVDEAHIISTIRIAERLARYGTFCLAFTKQYDMVSNVLAMGETFPENYTLLLSSWPPSFMPDRTLSEQFPLAIYARDWKEAMQFGEGNVCTGDCCSCGRCIGLRRDEYIVLIDHTYKGDWKGKGKVIPAKERTNRKVLETSREEYRRNLSENYGLTLTQSRKHHSHIGSRSESAEAPNFFTRFVRKHQR